MSIEAPLLTAANDDDVSARDKKRDEAMKFLAPAALSFIATEGPVSMQMWRGEEIIRRIGHNRGVWPGKIIKAGGKRPKEDPAKRTHKTYAFPARRQFSLWFRTTWDRDQLVKPVQELIDMIEQRDGGLDELPDGFSDLGPKLDFKFLELELCALARDLKVFFWDDAGLLAFLDQVIRDADVIAAKSRGGRYDPLEVAMARAFGRK
ncbi:hypothetical protein [Hyphomicrobium sp. 802]|uniref:hypothetical protein n=1 Tax=Hyphomicrobium sp. 802 TaxID=1112272 RepID=UPI00045EABD7|nr:hypothetical protein [Hyphomicrobium sp. 802]